MDGFHDRVLWTFLERPQYIEVADRFAEADRRPESQWLRRKDLPRLPTRDTREACAELADEIRACFRAEGRGYSCTVEPYQRDDAVYYFAYPEDHGRTSIEWEHGELARRPHRPAFEVVFVYAPERGTLDTHHRGARATVRTLNRAFGKVVLGVDLADEPGDERVYDLDRFKRRDVTFVFDPASGVSEISVVLLRLAILGVRRGRITVECDAKDGPRAIYDLLEAELRAAVTPVPYSRMHVTKVGLQAQFAPDGRRGRNTRTFTLTYPNACSLRHDGRDALLRQILLASGIEPVAPAEHAP